MDSVLPGGSRPAIRREQQESKSYSGAVQPDEAASSRDLAFSIFNPAVDAIFTRPIFKSKDFAKISRIPKKRPPE